MRYFLASLAVACMVAVCSGGRLENHYLPPHGAAGAGGHGNVIRPPIHPSNVGHIAAVNYPSGQGFFGGSGGKHTGGNYYPHNQGPFIPILRQDKQQNEDGSYSYNYETANGIVADETRKYDQAHGSYSYTGPDGVRYTVSYTADENGFHASGAHLPTPPPVPKEIVESLIKNAADEAAGIFDDGSYRGEGHHGGRYHGVGYNNHFAGGNFAHHTNLNSDHAGYRY